MGESYKGTAADQVAQRMMGVHGKQAGYPAKAGQAIVEVVTVGRMPEEHCVCRLVKMLCSGRTRRSRTSMRMLRN